MPAGGPGYYGSARGKISAYSATSVENMHGIFSYPKYITSKYVPRGTEAPNPRWKSKQFNTSAPHKGMSGSMSQDCLFEQKFVRIFDSEGPNMWSGSLKVKGEGLNSRAAYSNTCNSDRLRETLRKEMRVTARNTSQLSAYAHKILAEQREVKRPLSREERMALRRRRPTSASAIGERASLDITAKLNPETYAPPLRNSSAAYMCENAHRPVIKKDISPGFYRRTGGASMMAWAT